MNAIVKHGFDQEQISLIKSTIMSGKIVATDNDLALFGMICQKAGLDPFAKQIYAIERKGRWVFQISIDGYRAIADRTGQYAGSDEPLFDEGLELYEFEKSGRKFPTVCKVTVWKMVGGHRCPFVGVARYSEFVQTFKDSKTGQIKVGEMWEKMPLTMLAKCAETQALRKAFPQCNQATQEIEAIAVPSQTIATDLEQWRIDGYKWGVGQGVDSQLAADIANIAKDKKDLHQRMTAAIPVVQDVATVEVQS